MNEAKKVRVVTLPVGLPPIEVSVDDTYQGFTALLDGGFLGGQSIGYGPGRVYKVHFDDDFLAKALPRNVCGMRGPVFFAAYGPSGQAVSLTDAEVAKVRRWVEAHRDDPHDDGARVTTTSFESFDDMAEAMRRGRQEIEREWAAL